MINLQFVSLHPDAALPEANGADAMALDLRAVQDYRIGLDSQCMVNTGVVLSPKSAPLVAGMHLSLRSSFAMSNDCFMANGVGLIERSFVGFLRNENLLGISAYLLATANDFAVEESERFCQLEVYSAEGRLLLPNRDFTVEWDTSYYTGGASFLYKGQWEALLKPGGRGGFGSTGTK